jgi:N-acetylglucosaminyldiphosphoundecaprenol N-acetyl-beta-D-mannosaminyltransferase
MSVDVGSRAAGQAERGRFPPFDPPIDSTCMPTAAQPTPDHSLSHIDLRGVDLACVTSGECVAYIMDQLRAGHGGWMITVNLDIMCRIDRDPEFRGLVDQSTICVADGMPLVWAAKLQGTPLPERVAGSDLISSISAAAAADGRSIFLLGGNPGAAEGAAKVLTQRSPNLKIVGTLCPPMGFEKSTEEMGRIAEALRVTSPDVVFVALGCPKQEKLIAAVREVCPRAFWIGVGISFSFLTGEVQRAPVWMRKTGLEWVHRLFSEPKRMFRRYIIDDIPFALKMLSGAAFNRKSAAASADKQGGRSPTHDR